MSYTSMLTMANTAVCNDTSEALEFFEPQGLYLKPIGKLNVSVQLPQLKTPGKSISNWEVMEKLKSMIKPDIFISLKIVKSTLEFLRFEGEVENKGLLKNVLARVDGRLMKLSGFTESLKVRAAEAKVSFPSRHDWESFFRDAKNMNEMKSGERPDTLHIQDLPSRWFTNRKNQDKDKPSEYILKKVFDTYGNVRCVDIPMLDPYRKEMTSSKKIGSIQTFTFGQDLTFEAYVQYNEYVGFDRAMNALRGMKLMFKDKGEDGKAWTANIKVDFDKTKHLTDKSIRRRRLEREKLEALEKEREDKVRKEREEEERKKDLERKKKAEEDREKEKKRQDKVQRRVDRRKEREEKRKHKAVEKKRVEEEKKLQQKIAQEERLFLIAQRKLESLRLLTELFERVKVIKAQEDRVKQERELEEERLRQVALENKRRIDEQKHRAEMKRKRKLELQQQEKELREKILKNWRTKEERKEEVQREKLRSKLSGSKKLKSAVIMKR